MRLSENLVQAKGLEERDRERLRQLIEVYNSNESKNRLKERYYEGRISLGEVNLGLALPHSIAGLEIGCAWGEKAVDVLAARSMFDGFVGADGTDAATMRAIVDRNHLQTEYKKACKDELKFGCTFATLSADPELLCRIRFHSARSAAGLWDGKAGRIKCGVAVIDTAQSTADNRWRPSVVNLYTDTDIVVLTCDERDNWAAEYHHHRMGRPLMEPLVWNATTGKPFGRSRLKGPVRKMIQGFVRTVANATIGLEFSTSPQKYLLGVTEKQYDTLIDQKFKTYVGSILAATQNPETGENPVFGQLAQGTIEPHVAMMRMLSTQFSSATGLTVTDAGVVNDANPTSSDAILAQTQTLVGMAEELNSGNGDSLRTVALMAQAIARNVTLDELTEEERGVVPHFRNPAMPSVAVTADAAVKIASVRPSFANTTVFLEMMGFSQADIRRITAQESRGRGLVTLKEMEQ